MPRFAHCFAALFALAAIARAAPPPTEFPLDATSPNDDALRAQLEGKVFDVRLADGTGWRLDYRSGGHFFVDTSTGGRVTGRWRVQGGRLCSLLRGNPVESCNEVRSRGDEPYLKRDSGEVIRLVAR